MELMMPLGSPSQKDSVRMVSEILRRTNELIQKGELGRAQGELILANRAAKEKYKKTTIPSPTNDKFVVPPTPLPALPLAPMEALTAAISPQKQIVNVPPPQASVPVTKVPSVTLPEIPDDRRIEVDCYCEALVNAWRDGALTRDEKRQLQELRTVLEISDAEHEQFENEIKRLCYKEALLRHLSSDLKASSNTKKLPELQKAFHISQEEHLQIQDQCMQMLQSKQRDRILIIDDDAQLLNTLTVSMKEDGFDVDAVVTSDEAYTLLQRRTPDIILCDINLKTSTMDGFAFFQKVQGNKNFQQVPFIFLTGLTDEKLACTGKELGADDVLMKPISIHTLLSTLHGRLKRFKQLKGYSGAQTPAFC